MSGEVRVCAVGDIDESMGMDTPAPAPAARPADDTVRSVASADGEVSLSISQDLPALQQWMLDNAIRDGEVVQPDNLVEIALPVAGRVRFFPNQIRALASALATAIAVEEAARPTVPVANVDGVDYPREPQETTDQYEQRVIRDLMLRRGRELMRDHGLTAEQASSMVHEMVERQRYQDLISVNTTPAPTQQEAREFVSMEAEGQRRDLGDALRAHVDAGGVIQFADNVGADSVVTSDGVNMANIPIAQWTADMLRRDPGHEPEPTLREMWGD